MELSNLFARFQQLGPKLALSYCFVNGAIMALDEIQNMGYDEFALGQKSICRYGFTGITPI